MGTVAPFYSSARIFWHKLFLFDFWFVTRLADWQIVRTREMLQTAVSSGDMAKLEEGTADAASFRYDSEVVRKVAFPQIHFSIPFLEVVCAKRPCF